MEKIIKTDKFGRKHISGIIPSQRLTSSEIFEIGKECVFPIIFEAYIGEEKGFLGNGSSFIYKQIIYDNYSEIFLFTNLHVIQSINNSLRILLSNPDTDINFRLTLKFNNQDIEIKEAIEPKYIYYSFAKNYDQFKHLDFALIKVKVPRTEPINFFAIKEKETLKEGEKIYALGYPQGLNLSISDGIISHIYAEEETNLVGDTNLKNMIQHNILINPGNSGGPTIGEYGNIVGISTSGRGDSIGINFSLNIYPILEFIKNNENLENINIRNFIESLRLEAQRILSIV